MNLNKIGIIISHEYTTRVKKKSFLVITILTPLLIAACSIIPAVIMLNDGGAKAQKVVVLDRSGVVGDALKSGDKIEYTLIDPDINLDLEALKTIHVTQEGNSLIEISDPDAKGNVTVAAYAKKAIDMDLKNDIKRSVNARLEEIKLKSYDIEDLDQILKDIKSDVRIESYSISDTGEQKKDSFELKMGLAYLASFLIYMFVLMFGNMVMRGVIDEKSSKVVEVLVSSVKSVELMLGKIIGIALVALTQFVIWIVILVAAAGIFSAVAGDSLTSGQDVAAIAQQMGAADSLGADIDLAAAAQDEGIQGTIAGVLDQIRQINFGYIIVCFLLYFIFGYLLYASMFAAIGAAVDNEADTQQLSFPVTLPLILGLFIMLHTFQHPDSSLSFWCSMIPFTSPMVMMARVPFGVPAWELVLSVALLIGTFLLMGYLSAKIYKVGILTSGKKATFKDLAKWMKYRN